MASVAISLFLFLLFFLFVNLLSFPRFFFAWFPGIYRDERFINPFRRQTSLVLRISLENRCPPLLRFDPLHSFLRPPLLMLALLDAERNVLIIFSKIEQTRIRTCSLNFSSPLVQISAKCQIFEFLISKERFSLFVNSIVCRWIVRCSLGR